MMTRSWIAGWARALVAGSLVATACAPPAPPAPGAAAAECLVAGMGPGSGREITIGFTQPVDAGDAPVPTNSAEALLFPLLYQTLVRATCSGELRPGLAVDWRSSEGGHVLTFRLDPEARFWDGAPVTAADVASSLLERGAGGPASLGPPASILSVGVEDPATLTVRFRHRAEPIAMADPALGVARPSTSGRLPVGSGSYRPVAPNAGDGAPSDASRTNLGEGALVVEPLRSSAPSLRFREWPAADGRDILDQGADLLVTREPAVIDYVGMRREFELAPLPWDRTYVLLAPTRARALARDQAERDELPLALRERLARDAVTGGARPHGVEEGAWWTAASCERSAASLPPLSVGTDSVAARVVYLEGDETAGALAGRIVVLAALASRSGASDESVDALATAVPELRPVGGSLRAVGIPQHSFEVALRAGDALLYVLPLPLHVFDPCRELESLDRRAPWLAAGMLSPAASIIPLIDTRPYLVTRAGGLPAIYVDRAGSLRFEPPSAGGEDR